MALIDSLDRENRTPLHYAAAKGSLEVREEYKFATGVMDSCLLQAPGLLLSR